ncbi:MAG: TetR/AcrR family transcriptional regulator [Desulfuromonadaceae bacterium]|nr:TetR/AcrR family transcriptional regulator [Desulfuromonadaceae bacterium]
MTSNTTTSVDFTKTRSKNYKVLLDAALRLYATRGLDVVSVHEVAAEAGVTHGTAYKYFRSRDDIQQAVCMRLISDMVEYVKNARATVNDPAERISIEIRTSLGACARNHDWGKLFLRFSIFAPDFDKVTQPALRDLRAGLDTGRFRYGTESAALAFLTGAITLGMRPIVFNVAQPHHEAEVARLVLTGLGVPPTEAQRIVSLPLPEIPEIVCFEESSKVSPD